MHGNLLSSASKINFTITGCQTAHDILIASIFACSDASVSARAEVTSFFISILSAKRFLPQLLGL